MCLGKVLMKGRAQIPQDWDDPAQHSPARSSLPFPPTSRSALPRTGPQFESRCPISLKREKINKPNPHGQGLEDSQPAPFAVTISRGCPHLVLCLLHPSGCRGHFVLQLRQLRVGRAAVLSPFLKLHEGRLELVRLPSSQVHLKCKKKKNKKHNIAS